MLNTKRNFILHQANYAYAYETRFDDGMGGAFEDIDEDVSGAFGMSPPARAENTVPLVGEMAVKLSYKNNDYHLSIKKSLPSEDVATQIRQTIGLKEDKPINVEWLRMKGDPIGADLDQQREWDDIVRLHSSSQESKLFLRVFEGLPQLRERRSRIYGQRGARRSGKKICRMNGHNFVAKSVQEACCDKCKDNMSGQVYRCVLCKITMHKRCCYFLKPDDVCKGYFGPTALSDSGSGNTEEHTSNYTKSESPISLDDFTILKVIGRGYFGKVLMVELKSTKQIYAMKVLKKAENIEEDISYVQTEKRVLQVGFHHPYLVGLHFGFATESRLFFVMECATGGDMITHMQRHRRLPEEHARFYSAEISLALHYLHERGIIHREVILENILLDRDGHIKLAGFGSCKDGLRPGDTTSTFCGIPNYIAPEMLRGEDYGYSVDWWSLGIVLFEMLSGKSPWDRYHLKQASTNDELFQVILEKTVHIPHSLSLKSAKILNGFLTKNPTDRLGCRPQSGFQDITSHAFYKSIDWELLKDHKVTPPYKPAVDSDRDTDNFDPEFTSEPLDFTPDDPKVLAQIDHDVFKGFDYVSPLLMSKVDGATTT